MDGIINLNKPSGVSSFKAMSIVKWKLGLRKVGFLGTLDPLASGVLVLLCGRYTKMADQLHAKDGKRIYTLLQTHVCAVFTHNLVA